MAETVDTTVASRPMSKFARRIVDNMGGESLRVVQLGSSPFQKKGGLIGIGSRGCSGQVVCWS